MLTKSHDAYGRNDIVINEGPRIRIVRPARKKRQLSLNPQKYKKGTYTLALIVPILKKIEYKMNTLQTRLRNEIFASFAMSLYKHSGIEMKSVAPNTTSVLLEVKSSGTISNSLIITLVAVSPTTTL